MSPATVTSPTIATTWPEGFRADAAACGGFAVREVAAPADAVFAWARRIDLHQNFYPGLRFVRKLGGAWPVIDKGTKISFLVGPTFIPYLAVIACDPEARSFAWGGDLPGLSICHAFTVEPIAGDRALVRSEELWVGPIAKAVSPVAGPQIQKVQTDWADAIKRAADQHPGGPPAA